MRSITQSSRWLFREFGLVSVYQTGPDTWLVMLARACRMFAFGAISLIIALFLSSLDVSDFRIGLFMTLTLTGDVVLSLLVALAADRIGRRLVLFSGAFLMIFSGVVFLLFENYWLLLFAAVVGVLSATGGDLGPFRSVEESTLSHLTTQGTRSDVMSWYVTVSTLGSAMGTAISGQVVDVLRKDNGSATYAYHSMFWAYIGMGAVAMVCTGLMSRRCEASHARSSLAGETAVSLLTEEEQRDSPYRQSEDSDDGENGASVDGHRENIAMHPGHVSVAKLQPKSLLQKAWQVCGFAQISPTSRSIVYQLWILLTIDSLADGMVSYALTNYYLARKFDLSETYLGSIMSASYLLMAASTVLAGPLAKRLGLVKTMVYTHIPSSVAVLLFPLPQSIFLSIILLFIRTGLNNMDQGPRAALIAAVVKPDERTAIMGITGTLRTLGSTFGPSLTGFLAGSDKFWIAFVIAGALRLGYDLGLFYLFVGLDLEALEARNAPGQ
ncbi:major facilitator superfamily transporter [Metarhizium rileyi]|uniref:Major facilitator superfamily transporter n=1 Tax=Metarhizium rileyi (strain RCEF 4871) TaxID=1649241 RepID=A0A166YFI3_METRR|nr:major facilitator superfamily transporter [Metarhizium rileyi RCEF 4871]